MEAGRSLEKNFKSYWRNFFSEEGNYFLNKLVKSFLDDDAGEDSEEPGLEKKDWNLWTLIENP